MQRNHALAKLRAKRDVAGDQSATTPFRPERLDYEERNQSTLNCMHPFQFSLCSERMEWCLSAFNDAKL